MTQLQRQLPIKTANAVACEIAKDWVIMLIRLGFTVPDTLLYA